MADRVRGMRQRKHWHSLTPSGAAFTANATAILGSFTAGQGDPFTVLRFIGQALVVPLPGGTFAAADVARITMAVGIVSADALAVGASAMPDPDSEPDYPWLWWYSTIVVFAGASPAGDEITVHERVHIESKAMRKVGPRQSVVMVAQYVDIGGTPPMDVHQNTRFLVGE